MSKVIAYPFAEMQKGTINTDNTGVAKVTQAFKLPVGADVEKISIEVTTAFAASTTLKLGIVGDDDLFSPSAQSLATEGTTVLHVAKELNKAETLIATINQASATGEAVIRVHYALPSPVNRDY